VPGSGRSGKTRGSGGRIGHLQTETVVGENCKGKLIQRRPGCKEKKGGSVSETTQGIRRDEDWECLYQVTEARGEKSAGRASVHIGKHTGEVLTLSSRDSADDDSFPEAAQVVNCGKRLELAGKPKNQRKKRGGHSPRSIRDQDGRGGLLRWVW